MMIQTMNTVNIIGKKKQNNPSINPIVRTGQVYKETTD